MGKRIAALVLAACMALPLFGCGSKLTAQSLTEGVTARTIDTHIDLTDDSTAVMDFAAALLRQTTKEEGVLLSPVSLLYALGMTANGASGQTLSQLEKEKCPSIDAAADTFAQLLSGAADEVEEPVKRRVLAQMLYHLGRWIYLIDAADDLKKDAAAGSYNPLPMRYQLPGDTLTDTARQELAQTLDSSIRAMAAAFELSDFGQYDPIIESTVYQGLYAVGTAVLDGTFHQKKKVVRKKGGHRYA